jgi:hypothetical protein
MAEKKHSIQPGQTHKQQAPDEDHLASLPGTFVEARQAPPYF